MPNDPRSNDNNELNGLARDIVRELKATTELVVDAAKLGKDELLHYVSEGIRSNWPGGMSSTQSPRDTTPFVEELFREEEQKQQRSRGQRSSRPSHDSRQSDSTDYHVLNSVTASARTLRRRKVNRVGGAALPLYIVAGSFLFPALILWGAALSEAIGGAPDPDAAIVGGAFTLVSGILALIGGKFRRKEKLYARYRTAVGSSPRMALKDLAVLVRRSYGDAQDDVIDMVDRGYFGPEARFDVTRGMLIVDPYAAVEDEPAVERAASPESGDKDKGETAAQQPDTYEAMLLELRLLNERIEDEAMSNRIYRIEAVARATFLAVREKPEKRSQIQRFMDYYLPTTIKLLSAYADFEKQTVTGENIRRSRENIERMMETLSEAYEKQFDSLFRAETMDINAEIRTMDSLLRQDGFVGGFDSTPGVSFGGSAGATMEKKL